MEIENDVRLPSTNEPVDCRRLGGEQELVVPVQINPVRVTAGPGRAAVRIRLRDNGQLDGRKARRHFVRRRIEKGLKGPSRRPFVSVLPRQHQKFQCRAQASAP